MDRNESEPDSVNGVGERAKRRDIRFMNSRRKEVFGDVIIVREPLQTLGKPGIIEGRVSSPRGEA